MHFKIRGEINIKTIKGIVIGKFKSKGTKYTNNGEKCSRRALALSG